MPSADLPPYPPTDDEARARLLEFAGSVPLVFGPWRDLKGLYKQAEADANADPTLLGALIAQFDAAGFAAPGTPSPPADLGKAGSISAFMSRGDLGYVL